MSHLKGALVLAPVVGAAALVGVKYRQERATGLPPLAAAVKMLYRPLFRRAMRQAVIGRSIDRGYPERGRFTANDVERLLTATWSYYDELAPAAHLDRFETLGSRHNVLLGVMTLAAYRAFRAAGREPDYATELIADAAWKVYEQWIRLPRFIARLAERDPQGQMNLMLQMFLAFPFNRPGYQWESRTEPEVRTLDFSRCPVYEYFRDQGDEAVDVLRNSWCLLDFALAQVMTTGGTYEREHTLSAGDSVCDMRWAGQPPDKPETRNTRVPALHLTVR